MLAVPSKLIELFRCRGAAKDGGTLEYVLEVVEQNSPNAGTKEKAAEIAAEILPTELIETLAFMVIHMDVWVE